MRVWGQTYHRAKWCTFTPAKSHNMVHFYSGARCSFSPALTDEEGKFQDRQIEFSLLYNIVDKLIGSGNGPLLFPVFIKAVQDFSEQRNIRSDHVTPERMERFYRQMVGGQ